MTVYGIANHKGGVGKSVTAAELVAALARQGRRVLAVDCDQQGHLGGRLGIDADVELRGTLSEVLRATKDVAQALTTSPLPGMDKVGVLHGTSDLKDLEQDIPDLPTALRDTLPTVAGEWDDVVIDTPGDIGDLLLCGLAATEVLIVPVATRPEAVEQIEVLQSEGIDRVARRMNRGLSIAWILPTMHTRRAGSQRAIDLLTEEYGDKVLPPIPDSADVPNSFDYAAPPSLYRPGGAAARAYAAAIATITAGEAHR